MTQSKAIRLPDWNGNLKRVWIAKSNYKVNGGEKYPGMGPSPDKQIKNGSYSFSLCKIDPRLLTRKEAVLKGKSNPIWRDAGDHAGGQVWDMAHAMKNGDLVILETDSTDVHAVGIVCGDYAYNPKAFENRSVDKGAHIIPVNWAPIKGTGLLGGGKGDTWCLRLVTTRRRAEMAKRVLESMPFALPVDGEKENRGDWAPDPGYMEGSKELKTHMKRERSSTLAKEAKEAAHKKHNGRIPCECCRMVTSVVYEDEIIEAHHKEPLKYRKKPEITNIGGFAMLCPNCHRAVHRYIDKNPSKAKGAIEAVSRRFP